MPGSPKTDGRLTTSHRLQPQKAWATHSHASQGSVRGPLAILEKVILYLGLPFVCFLFSFCLSHFVLLVGPFSLDLDIIIGLCSTITRPCMLLGLHPCAQHRTLHIPFSSPRGTSLFTTVTTPCSLSLAALTRLPLPLSLHVEYMYINLPSWHSQGHATYIPACQ